MTHEPDNILQKILKTKRKELGELLMDCSLDDLKSAAADAPAVRNFFSAVTKSPTGTMNLIAEVKRASPSAGIIREDFDPKKIAEEYLSGGADAISVLTDREYFQGDLDYIRIIRDAVDLPIMRKDFLIDPAQIYQSRAAGADAVLLIAAALNTSQLSDMMILTAELKMTSLVEVHDADELLKVRSMIGFPHASHSILGINNRNLKTFEVDIATTLRLAELAGDGVPIVSESGIRSEDDVIRLKRAGVKAILVGETLMRSGDVSASIKELTGKKS